MAGRNRSELEKVLTHYEKSPADSLKLRAAEFLIANMQGKYSEYYDAPWNDVATVHLRWTSSPDKKLVTDTYRLGNQVIRRDVEYITADYLINNIELAFDVWHRRPWGKHIPFEAFCEDILPYRIAAERLENWREKALASFAALEEDLNKPDMTAVEACRLVCEVLPGFRMDKDFHDMAFSELMATTRGTCDEMSTYTTFVMRALGIPTAIDCVLAYTGQFVGHSWNAVRDSLGGYTSYMGTESYPGQPHQATMVSLNKVYRRTYAIQQDIAQIPFDDRPPLMKSDNLRDVSLMYGDFHDACVPLHVAPPDTTGRVYLAVLDKATGRNIVARGTIEAGHGVFPALGHNIGYFPVYYVDNDATPAGEPFMVDEQGNIHTIVDGPFNGPHVLSARRPYVLSMKDFDTGGEGVAFHETDGVQYYDLSPYRVAGLDPLCSSIEIQIPDLNLSDIAKDEWTKYTVEVRDAGTYLCQLNASGMSDGKFHLKVDGENVTGSVNVPANGAWFDWRWIPRVPLRLTLSAGRHEIQFYCEQVQFNVKDMKFTFLGNDAKSGAWAQR
jgi:hypothetical protein